MNIEIRTDGTARLTSMTGAVVHVLSNRKYHEVICRQENVGDYTDGVPGDVTHSPRMVFTRHEILKAMQAGMPELYETVKGLYQTEIELNIWWNSSNEINLNDADCIAWIEALGITQEMVDALRALIEGQAA